MAGYEIGHNLHIFILVMITFKILSHGWTISSYTNTEKLVL